MRIEKIFKQIHYNMKDGFIFYPRKAGKHLKAYYIFEI